MTMQIMNEAFISNIVDRMRGVRGVQAVVLGGSRGRGTAKPDSDWDIGIYFDSAKTFDIAALNEIARAFDDEHREQLCTQIGGWGPWVTGGGWLVIGGEHVDFIYRELPRVQRTVADCVDGRIVVGYQAGHPFGFVSSIYAGEVATCKLLHERDGAVSNLKAQLTPYPPALKRAIVQSFAWEVAFCTSILRKPAQRGDGAYAAGALFRGVMCMTQTLFAINKQWWLNEKSAVAQAAAFARTPVSYAERINEIFAANPLHAADLLDALDGEVGKLLTE